MLPPIASPDACMTIAWRPSHSNQGGWGRLIERPHPCEELRVLAVDGPGEETTCWVGGSGEEPTYPVDPGAPSP